MKILDNITNTVRDDLRVEIKKGSRVSIAAACFSMYREVLQHQRYRKVPRALNLRTFLLSMNIALAFHLKISTWAKKPPKSLRWSEIQFAHSLN